MTRPGGANGAGRVLLPDQRARLVITIIGDADDVRTVTEQLVALDERLSWSGSVAKNDETRWCTVIVLEKSK